MCGIIGYIGKRDASDIAIGALERLSYRGYDSAGIAVFSSGLHTRKCKGKIDALKDLIKENPLPSSQTVIGHTRWATHGSVTDANSHPHGNSNVLIVHNGIIENYLLLKSKLSALGYTFTSETDSEAAALLIDYEYKKTKNKYEAIRAATESLRGSYAILVMFSDAEDEIWCIRHESPLLVGIGEGETFISSDIPAFLSYTNKYFRLAEGEIAKVSRGGVEVFLENGEKTEKSIEIANFDAEDAKKGGFSHFMRKEISDEADIISKLCSIYSTEDGLPSINFGNVDLRKISHITIVGCGTAYHAGIFGKTVIEDITRIRCDSVIASEFRYSNPIIDENELVIFISQSGETADTLSSLRMAKELGAHTLGIVNTVGSSIATEADFTLYIHAGVEIAVASTKAYTAQCVVLAILTLAMAKELEFMSADDVKDNFLKIRELSKTVEACIALEKNIELIAEELYKAENLFFIGRRYDYVSAIEASLKLKEISYIHSEAYPAGELKHGTISLITDKTPVIALFGDTDMSQKTISNLKEVSARGAKTVAIAPPTEKIADIADIIFDFPKVSNVLSPIPMATVLQLLAFHIARLRGCDIDQPRNLAKSVTVE